MAMKNSTDQFKEHVDKGIHDDFMRGTVAGAQDGMGVKRRVATEVHYRTK
jgi:L-lactate dehydrogenase complex protein LldF